MAANTTITKMQNGNVLVQTNAEAISFPPDMQTLKGGSVCQVRDKSGSRQHVFKVEDIIEMVRRDGTVITSPNVDTLFFELSNFFFFKLGGSGGSAHLGVFDNYTDLVTQYPSAGIGDLAYVENSQGTAWLFGSIGGTFYSKGVYLFNGANWDSSVDEISAQLEQNINDILSLQNALMNHVIDSGNPHATTLVNLDDTNIVAPNVGDVLTYVGGNVYEMQTPAVGVPTFASQSFNVTTGSLPITSASIDFLNIDFLNFNGDIDLTSQLPTNLKVGSRVILRKADSTIGKIIFDDGVILYKFVSKAGEYLELYWNGTKFII